MMLLLIKLIPRDYSHLVTFSTKCQMMKTGSLNWSSRLYFCFWVEKWKVTVHFYKHTHTHIHTYIYIYIYIYPVNSLVTIRLNYLYISSQQPCNNKAELLIISIYWHWSITCKHSNCSQERKWQWLLTVYNWYLLAPIHNINRSPKNTGNCSPKNTSDNDTELVINDNFQHKSIIWTSIESIKSQWRVVIMWYAFVIVWVSN